MKLNSITIRNYRSIEEVEIKIDKLQDGSTTLGLIGINEAGKSSILKGIALIDNFNTIQVSRKDFNNPLKPIEIGLYYEIVQNELSDLVDLVKSFDKSEFSIKESHNQLRFIVSFTPDQLSSPTYRAETSILERSENNLQAMKIVVDHINKIRHKIIFWSAEKEYLISSAINLSSFASSPNTVSIPLKNCFQLAGITPDKIADTISLLSESTEREYLRSELGIKVTDHIKSIWPKHPIEITFDISDNQIHFHVKDEDVRTKPKTADQRSDGFKQFVSFLLTISAENKNTELNNCVILLDEPETHLHPKAQEDLLIEMTNLTKNNRGNVVIFATHSNYMIDKVILERNFKVEKNKASTQITKFDSKLSSYASVNYDVFDIISTDYHNELYGRAMELFEITDNKEFDKYLTSDFKCPQKKYKHTNEKEFECTLPTYIRHQIHHPENNKNSRFTNTELEKSTKILLDLIQSQNF